MTSSPTPAAVNNGSNAIARAITKVIAIAIAATAAGCSILPMTQHVESQAPVAVQAGAPVLIGAHEAARMKMANSGTFSQPTQTETVQVAPVVQPGTQVNSQVIDTTRDGMDQLIHSLDSGEQAIEPPKLHESSLEQDDAPESLWLRIRNGFAMPQLNSKLVADKERFYLEKPEYMQRMFKRGGRYLYHIVEEIERRGMPTEIALLPFVESAMNPVAMSHAKASGLWQFIPSTGRAYDLKQNWWVDNRRDVVQSTRAALDYLQMLHKMHDGDWFLALASYNWGEGSVKRAIRRNKSRGLSTEYTSLRMPRETRHYVPKLLALKNIIQNASQLQVALPDMPNEPYFVVLEKTRPIDLKLAAKFAGMTVKDFIALNPAHNRPVISATRNNMIKLPTENLDQFLAAIEDHEETGKSFVSWRPYTLKRNETIASVAKRTRTTRKALLKANGLSSKRRIISGTRILVPSNKATDAHIAKFNGPRVVEVIKRKAAYHRVKRRDTLTRIARRWGVSKRSLRRWNRLKSNKVYKGQRLLVRQPINQTVETTAMGKRKVISRGLTKNVAYKPGKMHRIQAGQNLGSIARRYGVRVNQLRTWNGLTGSTIRTGQRLHVQAPTVLRTAATRKAVPASTKTASAGHKVRRGDTLIRIASRYGTSVAQLRSLNGLRSSNIRLGQTLRVKAMNAAKPAAVAAKSAPVPNRATKHKVRRGDTLIRIARRYGVSVAQLRSWNALKTDNIRLGQRLTIESVESAGAPKPESGKAKKVS